MITLYLLQEQYWQLLKWSQVTALKITLKRNTSILIFIILAIFVQLERTIFIDAPVINAIQSLSSASVTVLMKLLTHAGDKILVGITAVAIAGGLFIRHRQKDALMVLVTIGGSAALNIICRSVGGYCDSTHPTLSVADCGFLRRGRLYDYCGNFSNLSRRALSFRYSGRLLREYCLGSGSLLNFPIYFALHENYFENTFFSKVGLSSICYYEKIPWSEFLILLEAPFTTLGP